jgi:hypothetical protein
VAKAQVKHGYTAASYFSRALSGELHPSQLRQEHPAAAAAAACEADDLKPRLTVIKGGKTYLH